MAGRHPRGPASHARKKLPIVSIVKNSELKNPGRVWREIAGVMLSVEPTRRVVPANQLEIAVLSKPPENVSRTFAVPIINLNNPTLMADGEHEVMVVGRIEQRIAVSPIWEAKRMAADIEIIERIPNPGRIEVRIHVYQQVADHLLDARNAGEVGKRLRQICQQDQMSVRQS